MAKDAKSQARVRAERAQQNFERAQGQLDLAAEARREEFRKAATAGLSMAEIAEAVGLHRTRVNQIIHGK